MQTLAQKHNFISEAKFRAKMFLLIARRQLQNTFAAIPLFKGNTRAERQPVIATSESNLWNVDDNPENWILTAGKIQNLRIAAKRLNGLEVPAGQTFSFWKHIGNPNIGKGYVVGREIREGCIVPTIAGGLCQLSNALYDAALNAGFEIIERHRHTQIIKGSLAEQNRDATVKWNYVDLRFRSAKAFWIDINMTSDQLVVTFRGVPQSEKFIVPFTGTVPHSKLNDCYSCGNIACFKHSGQPVAKHQKGSTTFIIDNSFPEYHEYIKTIIQPGDFIILPAFKNTNVISYGSCKNIKVLKLAALSRSIRFRLNARLGRNIFATKLQLDQAIAKTAIKHIPLSCTHVLISQNLLPFVWASGALGGRTFDVLMTRMPIEHLQQRLNLAHTLHPESPTLNDFRASAELIDLENTALTKSSRIITPHQEIAALFNNKAVKLNWSAPQNVKPVTATAGNKILFPASALGRKGAYEVKCLAQQLNLTVVITGKATEAPNFWTGVTTETAGPDMFANIALIVYPTYIESSPRLLLKALAAGIHIITTTASGLAPAKNLTILEVGDYDALKDAVGKAMHQLEFDISPNENSHHYEG